MIGRTEFHNVSGTRCATDFVELPSILMEHFLTDPAVIGLTAHHQKTGAPLPYRQLEANLQTQRKLDALDAQQQILLAQLDQAYHAEAAGTPGFSTTAEMQAVQNQIGLFPFVPDSTWQGQFGHLFGYGATYYSYLFDRAIAARVWNKVFQQNPLSREAGETFKKDVLQHGGGKNPWSMLSTVLRDDQIAAGDMHAMQTIGYVLSLTQPLGIGPFFGVNATRGRNAAPGTPSGVPGRGLAWTCHRTAFATMIILVGSTAHVAPPEQLPLAADSVAPRGARDSLRDQILPAGVGPPRADRAQKGAPARKEPSDYRYRAQQGHR